MRLNINNDKPYITEFLIQYLNHTLVGQKVDAVINGIKYQGIFEKEIEKSTKEPYTVLNVQINGKKEQIPVHEEKTIIRLGKTLYVLETETHYTVIEIIV